MMTTAEAVLRGTRDAAVVRDLVARLTAVLANDMTKGGHVAIRNERERTGYCSRRRCSKICQDRWALLNEAAEYLVASDPDRYAAASEALLAREERPLFSDVPVRTEQLRMEV